MRGCVVGEYERGVQDGRAAAVRDVEKATRGPRRVTDPTVQGLFTERIPQRNLDELVLPDSVVDTLDEIVALAGEREPVGCRARATEWTRAMEALAEATRRQRRDRG